jgi:hypothetical protein
MFAHYGCYYGVAVEWPHDWLVLSAFFLPFEGLEFESLAAYLFGHFSEHATFSHHHLHIAMFDVCRLTFCCSSLEPCLNRSLISLQPPTPHTDIRSCLWHAWSMALTDHLLSSLDTIKRALVVVGILKSAAHVRRDISLFDQSW